MAVVLIADSGATKCEWCLLEQTGKLTILTTGINPYFLSKEQIIALLQKELLPSLSAVQPDAVFFYGSGLGNTDNQKVIQASLKQLFPDCTIETHTDILAAARAACNDTKGVVSILGTGSNSCYYNGKLIKKNIAGAGYILGDEGSGAYLGKKVVQHYLYNTYDEDLRARFDAMFVTSPKEILENVYSRPLPNRYLASFTRFLADNRGHYMVENILEDGINDFFFHHLCKYKESWRLPVHFAGGVAFAFSDVVRELCKVYEFELGNIIRNPIEGLIFFHQTTAKTA